MHSNFSFSKPVEVYNYYYTSDHAIWAIALVNYWVTHALKVANCNGFYFNAYPLGLSPNGTLHLFMVLYDPHSMSYMSCHRDGGRSQGDTGHSMALARRWGGFNFDE